MTCANGGCPETRVQRAHIEGVGVRYLCGPCRFALRALYVITEERRPPMATPRIRR